MQTSFFVFASDLHDEGYDQVLANLQERGGAQAATLAVSYHHARDVFPHNPRRRVGFHEGGAIFFRHDQARYAGLKIQPSVSRLVAEGDPLASCAAAAERRGMAVRAWTTNVHNTTLGTRYPECAIQNAFGDRYITNLCPANPDVRAYLRTLSADIARYPVEAILLESISYQPFDHGYHHERSFVALPPAIRFLLGLCFCESCAAAARAAGVAIEQVQRFVQQEVGRVFEGVAGPVDDLPVEHGPIAALAGGELGRLLEVRQATVTSLVAEVSEVVAAAGPARAIFMDMSGAMLGYATGRPTGGLAHTRAWQDGVDLAALARACHGVAVLGYAHSPERLRADLGAYQALLPAGAALSVGIRPTTPDCEAAEELIPKIRALREHGVAWMDVYHYGLMRLLNLDWVGAGLRAA